MVIYTAIGSRATVSVEKKDSAFHIKNETNNHLVDWVSNLQNAIKIANLLSDGKSV